MKKLCFYVLASLFVLALLPVPASAQNSRAALEEFFREAFSRKQQEGEVAVSRKKTETGQEGRTTRRESQSPSRKSGGYKKPQERRENSRAQEHPGRNRQDGYEGQSQERRSQRSGRCGESRSGARAERYGSKSGHSKCGAAGCHRPGKHKGLHKH